jgi:carotenoid cleavage dioxygenase-like enzyme
MFVSTLLLDEMFTFGYSHEPPYCTYRVINKEGAMLDPVPITIPESVMMHDFAITENYSIFMDLPLLFRPKVCDIDKQKTFCATYLHSADGCPSRFLLHAVRKCFKFVFISISLLFYIIVYRKW